MANWPLHQLLVIHGTTVGGDVWSTSLKTIWGPAPGLQLSFADQETLLKTATAPSTTPGIADQIKSWWNAPSDSSGFGSVFNLVGVKFNSIGHDGKYVYPDTSEVIFNPSAPGTYTGTGVNPRSSLVLTMRASYDRGRGAFGRMYPPMTGEVPQPGTAYVTTARANVALTRMADLLNIVQGALVVDGGDSLTVCNISPGPDGGQSIVAPITRLEVDRVIDTQRRRTNRIPRQVVSAAFG